MKGVEEAEDEAVANGEAMDAVEDVEAIITKRS